MRIDEQSPAPVGCLWILPSSRQRDSLQVNCEGRLQEGMQGFLQLPWRLVQSANLVSNLCMSDIFCGDNLVLSTELTM